jgi:hypothetical protein
VHSFCIELMPDFQPTSEVTWLSFFSKPDISSSNHDLDFFTCRIQCLPLEQGQLLIMQYAQSQPWDLDPQPWLNWWLGMLQQTQFSQCHRWQEERPVSDRTSSCQEEKNRQESPYWGKISSLLITRLLFTDKSHLMWFQTRIQQPSASEHAKDQHWHLPLIWYLQKKH